MQPGPLGKLGPPGDRPPAGVGGEILRRRLELPLAALAVYAGWFDWGSGLSYGPRLLVPALPCLALALAAASERLPRVTLGLIGLGLLVELPGALVAHPRVPDPGALLDLAPLHAWAALTTADLAILRSPVPALALLAVGLAGVVLEFRDRGG